MWRTYLKLGLIKLPSKTFVFLDEHPDSINDAAFAVACSGASSQPGAPGGTPLIIDFPASYHNGAAGFSFSDGHAEIHKWIGKTIKPGATIPVLGIPALDSARDVKWMADNTTVLN